MSIATLHYYKNDEPAIAIINQQEYPVTITYDIQNPMSDDREVTYFKLIEQENILDKVDYRQPFIITIDSGLIFTVLKVKQFITVDNVMTSVDEFRVIKLAIKEKEN